MYICVPSSEARIIQKSTGRIFTCEEQIQNNAGNKRKGLIWWFEAKPYSLTYRIELKISFLSMASLAGRSHFPFSFQHFTRNVLLKGWEFCFCCWCFLWLVCFVFPAAVGVSPHPHPPTPLFLFANPVDLIIICALSSNCFSIELNHFHSLFTTTTSSSTTSL